MNMNELHPREADGLGDLYDRADEMDLARWHQIDLETERQEMTEKALDACLKAGVAVEHLRTLVRECQATEWALRNSLRK